MLWLKKSMGFASAAMATLACVTFFVTVTSHAQMILVPQREAVPAAIGLQLHDLGRQVGDYLDSAERLHLRLVQLRAQLDDCRGCGNEASLQAEYNRLDQFQQQRRQGEGLVLHTMGFPYNDFSEAAKAMFGPNYQSPDPVAAQRIARAKWNAELNYCYISNDGNVEKASACRAVYNEPKAESAAQSVPADCFKQIHAETNVNLDQVPPPSATPAQFAAYKAAWSRYDACRQNGDIYQWIQHETARLCRADKIDITADLPAFACACEGISRPSPSNCPVVSQSKPMAALPRLVNEHPVGHILLTDPGPDLLGIRLLMPTAEAEKIVAAHMPIGRTAVIGRAEHGQAMLPQLIDYHTGGFTGKLLISQDGNEFIFLLEASRSAPGRVFEAARARWLPVGKERKAVEEEQRARGEPASVPGLASMFWGAGASFLCAGRAPRDTGFWVDQSTGWPLGGNVSDPRDRADLRLGIISSVRMPRLGPQIPMSGVYECGPILDVVTGGNPGDPARTGHPMWVVEDLFDIGLTQWFWSKGEDSMAP